MNEHKLNQLFKSATAEASPTPTADFENRVVQAIRREQDAGTMAVISLFDQLGGLFPRLAWAAALVVASCIAVDFGLGLAGVPDLTEGLAQISDQWLFTANGF